MEYEKLTYLGVKELYPHPDNPRLDIGDITELVESVRANGILQNLTVIPGRKGTPEEMEHIKALREKLAADDKAPEKLKREALEELDEQIRDEWVANGPGEAPPGEYVGSLWRNGLEYQFFRDSAGAWWYRRYPEYDPVKNK